MQYRRTRPSDRPKIHKMLENANLKYDGREPLIGFVAEGDKEEDDGKLIGVSYVHKAAIIDPFICENALAAIKLFYGTQFAISALDFNTVVVQVNAANTKLLDELTRLGFSRVESGYAIFKKVSRE